MTDKLSIKEIEDLDYYNFMAYMNVPFFNIGGNASIDILAELTKIDENSKILNVGCGTGTNSCYLAQKFGCQVIGIDIAEHMIKQATMKAEELGLTDLVSFRVGDAYDLDFKDNVFDIVLTVFVSQFLDPVYAFSEFFRVLKPGGYFGLNEMYKADNVPSDVMEGVDFGENVFRELTELSFTLRSPSQWREYLSDSGFNDIICEEFKNVRITSSLSLVDDLGGWGKILSSLVMMISLGLRSAKIRRLYGKINRGKRVLLWDKTVSNYIGYIICSGRKP
jgi:ubiquinone/menaquinone biosynthesis C-methylase UbiE